MIPYPAGGATIFMFHQVGPFPPMRDHRALFCHVDRFDAHLRWLRLVGANVIALSEAAAALRGERPMPPRAVVLTFDDGTVDFVEHALPVLQRHGCPATIYPVADLVGGHAGWMAAAGLPVASLMDFATLRELPQAGVEVGCHGRSHRRMAGLSADELASETTDARRRLEDGLGRAVKHFCYPYGSHDVAAIDAVAAADFETATTCTRATATPAFDPLALPRKAVSYGDNGIGLLFKLLAKHEPKGAVLHRSPTSELARQPFLEDSTSR